MSELQPDLLSIEVPAPGEMFKVRTVHADNVAATQRALAKQEKTLKPAALKRLTAMSKDLEKQLNAAGYWEKKEQYIQLYDRILELKLEWRTLADTARINWENWTPEQRYEAHKRNQEIKTLVRSLTVSARQLQNASSELVLSARQYRAVISRLEEHRTALKRKRHHAKLSKELADEAYDLGFILQTRLAELGFKQEIQVGKRHKVKKVKFYAPQVTPDQTWFKVVASTKGLFGFIPQVPTNTKIMDIISEETCKELSVAVQRHVQGRYTVTNGAWLIVNRIGNRDGLLEYVTLPQVLTRYDARSATRIPVYMGVKEGRELWQFELVRYPHLLIGGSTDTGKSNAEAIILCTCIQKLPPTDIRFVLIDLKEGLEFQHYENIPHLIPPVVTEVEAAAKILAQLEELRRQRAGELKRYWARDINEYNSRVTPNRKMPRIVVFFDEYAAINAKPDVAKTIQGLVMQLLNKGRAAGIHLVICTQNPSVDILPGVSKNNIALRFATLMPTKAASSVILGVGDAADLPGDIKGRMIAMTGAKKEQIQAAHVRFDDLQQSLEIAMEWGARPEIVLPETTEESIGFDEQRLISIALEDFGGALKSARIYETVRDENISRPTIERMVKRIVEKKTIDFNGQQLKVILQKGNYYKLVT